MMRGLYYDGAQLRVRDDLAKPRAAAGQSLVKILYAAICNTDKEILKGYKANFRGVLGHEFVGVVEQSDRAELIGKTVVGELNEGCGHCIYCRTQREKHCETRKVIGIDGKWGAFAEYMQIATHLLHIVPAQLSPQKAVYCEPLAAALEIIDSVHIKPSVPVALLGDGKLAYMIGQIIALTGVDLTVIGKSKQKLAPFKSFAKTALSSDLSYEIVIDATGSPSGLQRALKHVRKRGKIIIKSTYAGNTSLDMSYIVINEIQLIGTRCGPFAPALNLLSRDLIDLPEIAYFDFKEFDKAFAYDGFKAGFTV